MALTHDYIIRANFTSPHLKEEFSAFALVVLGYSVLLNSTALGIYLCKTSQLDNFKMRLGGEICTSDVNMLQGPLQLKRSSEQLSSHLT